MGKTPGLITAALAVTAAAVAGVTLVRRAADDRVGENSGPCRGTVGIEVTGLSRAWRSRLGLPDEVRGAVVTEVLPRGPAAKAGLRVGEEAPPACQGQAVLGLIAAVAGGGQQAEGNSN